MKMNITMKVFALVGTLLLPTVAALAANTTVADVPAPPSKFLAATSPDLDMTSAAMEAAITDLMLGKTKFAATPMGGSIKKIMNLIKYNMMPKIRAAHNSDQRRLKKLADAIKRCGSKRNIMMRPVATPRKAYIRVYSPRHKRCRRSEAVLYMSRKSCMNRQRATYREKVLRCNYFAQLSRRYGTQKANFAIVKKAGSEKTEQYIRRISGTICGSHVHCSRGQCRRKGGWGGGLPNSMLDKYLKAKQRCNHAKRVYKATVKECRIKYHRWRVTRGKCNQYQRGMDSNSCKAAVLTNKACVQYAGCYYSARKNYEMFRRRCITEQTDRKPEWRGVMRMSCLMEAFADGKVTHAEIDACKKKTVDTKWLNLRYPKIPRLKRCVVPTLYPATGAYKRREFKPLPTNAKNVQPAPCTGIDVIPTRPRRGSPRGTKCARVSLLGHYSPGALIKCTNGFDVRRSKDKNSCPRGTKIFSPRTRNDWKTFLASAGPLRAPHWIIDVTRPARGCGGCTRNPMNSGNRNQKTWKTSDGSPWWLRSSRMSEPNGDYSANCFLDLWHGRPRNENVISFNDGNCNYHSKSYYCQPINIRLKPKSGSPRSCRCSKVDLTGRYLAGVLVKCEQCITVYRSTQKNSCPNGMKIFSPASRRDWKTFLASAGPLRAPHWIIDVTRPRNGCGGCKRYSMKSSTPQQATWRTSDGSPWWLRSTRYSEPNGDYRGNCFLNLNANPASPDVLRFNDWNCNYRSRSYYCQPTRKNKNYGGHHRRRRAKPVKKRSPVRRGACFVEEQFYIGNMRRVPNLNGRNPTQRRNRRQVWHGSTGRTWSGFRRSDNFAVRWTTNWRVNRGSWYWFWINSDDGSKLYVDNRLVVNNDGLHGMRARSGRKVMRAGRHTLKLDFFERGGGAGMLFQFRGADTRNRWSRGPSYGRMTCPKRKAAGMKPPVGIVQNYDQRKLFRAGWKVWKDVAYKHHTVRRDIQPTRGKCIMWGSKRSSGTTTLTLAAFGRRKVIQNKKRVWENGVYWYTQTTRRGSGSCGFSPSQTLSLNSADTQNSQSNLRLSWHLHTNMKVGGYRSGKTKGLNNDRNWRKVVMYGPCSGVTKGKR